MVNNWTQSHPGKKAKPIWLKLAVFLPDLWRQLLFSPCAWSSSTAQDDSISCQPRHARLLPLLNPHVDLLFNTSPNQTHTSPEARNFSKHSHTPVSCSSASNFSSLSIMSMKSATLWLCQITVTTAWWGLAKSNFSSGHWCNHHPPPTQSPSPSSAWTPSSRKHCSHPPIFFRITLCWSRGLPALLAGIKEILRVTCTTIQY